MLVLSDFNPFCGIDLQQVLLRDCGSALTSVEVKFL